ncbi:flavocytochrome C [Chromatiales bacterium (ex Bugula neritina AB1)]|nr:flavocytochrome C [Chromatiales bacterium (ex Bugula neritina AB1)]
MTELTRRQFTTLLGAGALSFAVPFRAGAQGKPSVVVVGGGAAGATAARYIAKDSDGAIDVTLVTASDTYTTCFFSNLYLGDFRTLDSITHNYKKLADDYGIKVVHGYANEVDRGAKAVKMADGSSIAYDRLVVAPGIDLKYDSVAGYSKEASELAPHAWQAGAQTQLLKSKLDALENGQDIIMVPPPNPYRCPPGPYERVSMMAHILKTRGLNDSKIIVLDPKPKFSKQALFQEGWSKHYDGMIEWYGPDVHGGIAGVDAEAGTVETDLDSFKGAVLNVIPAQQAGAIAGNSGLTNDTGFCPIEAASMRSTIDENIYVIGDASIAFAMPKSGFSANSQAKVAAMNIRGDLLDSKVFPAKYSNTCWSLIGTDDGVKVGAQYAAVDGKIASTSKFISATGEDAALRKTTYEESIGWYDGITSDIFG